MESTTITQGATPAPLISGMGDGCSTCGSALAADQRYCLQCGERRGSPRLPFMDGRGGQVATDPAAPLPPRPRRGGGLASSGTAIIAGIATLLLAMGVGVLIGRAGHDDGSSRVAAQAPVQVVTIGGGAAAAGTAAAATTTPTAAAGTSAKSSAKAKAAAAKKAAASAKANPLQAAAKKAGVKLPPSAVKIGSKGTGAGYKNGKFTGDFFGN